MFLSGIVQRKSIIPSPALFFYGIYFSDIVDLSCHGLVCPLLSNVLFTIICDFLSPHHPDLSAHMRNRKCTIQDKCVK